MDNFILLKIPEEKYRFLIKTLDSFKNGLRVLSLNQTYKKSLLKDIHIVESIIKTNYKRDM